MTEKSNTNDRHSLLSRQIRRHLPDTPITGPWLELLRSVDDAYRQSDKDRAMLERALEISSQELLQANSQTRAILEATPSLFLRVAFDGTVLEAKPGPLVDLFCSNAQPGDAVRRLVLRPDFLERFRSALVPLSQGKSTVTFEVEPDRAPGRLFEIRVVTVGSNQAVVVILDLTEQRAAEAAVRKSESQFRGLIEAMPQLIWIKLPTGEPVYFNQQWIDYTGMSFEESRQGNGWKRAIHPEDLGRAEDSWLRAAETGERYEVEYRVRRADGTYHWMLGRALPLRDDAGVIVKWMGTCTDVDQLRQALDAVSSSEERLRVIARVTSDVIWDWSIASGRIQWNEGLTVRFGHLPHEVDTVEAWSRLIHTDDRPRIQEGLRRILNDGNGWSVEYHVQRKDGTFAYILDRAHIIRDAAGNPIRIIGSMTDLTLRRAAEEKLAQQAALIDEARDAIFVRDLDHRITFWSKGAERIYGWSANDAIGKHCDELLHLDRAAVHAGEEVIREGEWSGEMKRTSASGAILNVNSRWTLMRDGQGRPRSILAIETDMTERKKLEAQFLRAQRMESIGTLSGGIAHDLNNLLMPIMMGVDLLKRFQPGDREMKVIRSMEVNVKRGADVVKQMLSFARGSDGPRVAVLANEIVGEVQSIAENTFPKSVRFETDLPDSLWPIQADPTQIHQVLLNLCVNARDAMPGGGLLTISARNTVLDSQSAAMHGAAVGNYVVLTVTDNGTGMTREVVDRIFEPFFTTKELGKGTGLGMSTALGIVRGHGGFLDILSEPGEGSTIEVYLPADASSANVALEPRDESFPRGQGETILIVDDEASILSITKQTLESFGYNVITAGNGAEAIGLYALHHEKIAAVLTDMMMPVMDGQALIAAMRRIVPDVKVVIASGQPARLENMNVHHALSKPYNAEVLLCTLNTILKEGRGDNLASDARRLRLCDPAS
jgi:PAS domain S-box-containing protein